PTPPPTPPIATPLPPGPVTPTPPVEDSKELQENTRKLRDSIDAIMRRWASDRDHETALSQLEALKEMKVLPDAYYLLPDAIRRIEAARDEDGRRAYESIRAEVEHHLGRGDYAAARKAVERFPEKLRLAGDWWQKTKELLAQIERSEKAKGRFSSLNENVERLLLEQKLNEAKQVLKEAEAELKDTPYEEHLKRLVAEVDRKIEEMEKKRQEEEEAKRKMLEAMRNQTPLFFADFSKGKIEGTFRVVLKDCGFPALVPGDAPSRPNAVRFLKTDSTSVVELQFKLPKPPLSGLLTLKQFLPPPPQNMAALTSEIELFLNEKSIEKRLLSGQPQGGEFTAEFELRELKAGENTIKITHTGGIHRYFLIGVELRLALPQDVLSALKETVEKEKESITKANADFLHQYSEGALLKWKASIDKDGGKPPKKNEWEPLFDGATLRFWHPLDNYAEWRVEGGSIVCVNKSNQWSSLEPYIKKMYDWLEYDLKYEIVHEGQGYGGVEFFVQYMTDFGGPRGSVRFGAMEPNIAQQVTGKRFSMLVEVRENRLVFFVNGQKMESEGRPPEGHKGIGYFCLLAGPNSTVRFKDVQIKLYKTK
ncbi:MAG: hypothetical protein N2234_09745, partial [Planctomycetota bacterium]|nr:hypothetical protein [Planctomycetota bacterium]